MATDPRSAAGLPGIEEASVVHSLIATRAFLAQGKSVGGKRDAVLAKLRLVIADSSNPPMKMVPETPEGALLHAAAAEAAAAEEGDGEEEEEEEEADTPGQAPTDKCPSCDQGIDSEHGWQLVDGEAFCLYCGEPLPWLDE